MLVRFTKIIFTIVSFSRLALGAETGIEVYGFVRANGVAASRAMAACSRSGSWNHDGERFVFDTGLGFQGRNIGTANAKVSVAAAYQVAKPLEFFVEDAEYATTFVVAGARSTLGANLLELGAVYSF